MYLTTKKRATSMRPSHGSPVKSLREIERERRRRKRLAQRNRTLITAAALIALSAAWATTMSGERAEAEVWQPTVQPAIQAPAEAPAAQAEEAIAVTDRTPYFDVPLDHELQDVVFDEAERWNVPAALILAIIDQETDYRTDVVSSTDDYGLMQINSINHDWLADELGITDFMDPAQSIRCGAFMIGRLVNKYDGDLHHALTAYNRGEGGARSYYKKNGTYETSYSTSVLATFDALTKEGRMQNAF